MHRGKEIWLESNTHNYIVHEGIKIHIDNKGNKIEKKIHPCYYSRFDLALERILTKGIRNSDATTLTELYDEVIELRRLILNKTSLL